MLKFVADEDFNNRILRGLLRREPTLDIVRIQDLELIGVEDPSILEWAFQEGRILLTHDVSTMIGYAYERINTGRSISGLVGVPQSLPVGTAIEDILTVATCSSAEEFQDQILFLPL